MSPADLEIELRAWREPAVDVPPSDAEALSIDEALAYRAAGNLPDERDRSLRLVLVLERPEPGGVERERLRFEPDYHEAPSWRRRGSKPVNVVPLSPPGATRPPAPDAWWEDETMAALEREWAASGSVAGLVIPAEWRGFVFKTIASLRAAGLEPTVGSVVDSVARWLPPGELSELRRALEQANR